MEGLMYIIIKIEDLKDFRSKSFQDFLKHNGNKMLISLSREYTLYWTVELIKLIEHDIDDLS